MAERKKMRERMGDTRKTGAEAPEFGAERAMANEVQARFAEEPSVAREVLRYGNPAATPRKSIAPQKKAAMSVTVEEA